MGQARPGTAHQGRMKRALAVARAGLKGVDVAP
jgi:hypothetical protein